MLQHLDYFVNCSENTGVLFDDEGLLATAFEPKYCNFELPRKTPLEVRVKKKFHPIIAAPLRLYVNKTEVPPYLVPVSDHKTDYLHKDSNGIKVKREGLGNSDLSRSPYLSQLPTDFQVQLSRSETSDRNFNHK
ncbi:hypothetical protein AVEN_131229-1 [Araneus ventricosus]|uniref:Uncharacterized protein n=1 Tax=Araneus ventricosus TaxID=182803 RepID=A0A4Y2IPP2_ARAVE|nr:hypothetical protein AVEN_131229-1 [Araneus ventricosus]